MSRQYFTRIKLGFLLLCSGSYFLLSLFSSEAGPNSCPRTSVESNGDLARWN